MKKFLLLAALFILPVAALATPADAQTEEADAEPDSRNAGCRSVSGPQVEQVPGGALLLGAYGFAWVAALLFFMRVHKLSSSTNEEIARLRLAVESLESR